MKHDDSRPTLSTRLNTTALLLDREANKLEGYVPERDREAMLAAMQAGWREVARIRARAIVNEALARHRAGS